MPTTQTAGYSRTCSTSNWLDARVAAVSHRCGRQPELAGGMSESGAGGMILMADSKVLISFTNIAKTFGRTHALIDVDLDIRGGEVLGLVGANGAGKSTLLRIIAGTLSHTSGEMYLDGKMMDRAHYHARIAQEAGIHSVYQELSLCNNLTVMENFELSRNHSRGRSRAEMRIATSEAINQVFPSPGIGPRTGVERLRYSQRQMVEIARAAAQPGLRLLILDEPTSSLSSERVVQLHDFLRQCTEREVAIIYVTHKLDEVMSIANRIVVLRSGRKVWEVNAKEATRDALVEQLGGVRDQEREQGVTSYDANSRVGAVPNDALLAVVSSSKFTTSPHWNGSPFVVNKGEVVGIAGLEGSGQRELLRNVFFATGKKRGRGTKIYTRTAYVSGDRKREGIFPIWSIEDNLLLSGLRDYANKLGILHAREMREVVKRWIEDLAIVAKSPETRITDLSGGNQQKVLIARGLASGAHLLIMDDPTRGVDLESKESVYTLLRELRTQGRSAIYFSTEDAEFRYCDRVYVFAGGQIVHELVGPQEISAENIVAWSYRGLEAVGKE